MSNHNLVRSTKSYRDALLATEHLEPPSLGFIKPSEHHGPPFVTNAIIKQNNSQLFLLVRISETLTEIQSDLKTLLERQGVAPGTSAIPDDLITKLTALSLGRADKPK